MRELSASELLRVWERGYGQTPARRALILLAWAKPEMSVAELTQLSIGQRDAQLLTLREQLFGAQMESIAACPECRETLELTINIGDIRAEDGSEIARPLAPNFLELDGYEVSFRAPNSEDLDSIAACRDSTEARDKLLARCAFEIRRDGLEESADRLPANVIAALNERVAQVDRQANVQLNLTCPACSHRWLTAFDIASFLWSEITDWAQRLLGEIHTIASAYGWRETDILGMSAQRRRFYLEMIGVT